MKCLAIAATLVLLATACVSDNATEAATKLTVVTHDSFTLPQDILDRFAKDTGYEVDYVTLDSGALVNQLVLTKDSPLGDVVYGIDNTFASRAAQEGVLSDYDSPALPESANALAADQLTPIDFGDVCINADTAWFDGKGLRIPTTLDDLTKPEYKDLTVVINPTGSSTGLAFLLTTVGAKGDGWLDYWKQLKDNGVRVAADWSQAYQSDFSGADGKGPRPLVLSYATSPAYTVTDGASTTQALLRTCFRQVEYAGVIAGTQNEKGAQRFIDFMLSDEVQAAIPESMYMYPANIAVELPKDWTRFAPLATEPVEVPAGDIAANRDQWLRQWSEAMG